MLLHDKHVNIFIKKIVSYGIKDIVISPGSRSTPLVSNLLKNKNYFNLKMILDERSAAFFSLGVSKVTKTPTIIICTSGTAPLNYLPAVAEAYHSRVPLIVITADRPMIYRNSGSNQTLNQTNIYNSSIKWFYDIPVKDDTENSVHIENIFDKAIMQAVTNPYGPVHINWQFEEPLSDGENVKIEKTIKIKNFTKEFVLENTSKINEFLNLVINKKGILLAGPEIDKPNEIIQLANFLNWPIIADPLSNVRNYKFYDKATIIDTADILCRSSKLLKETIETVIHVGAPPVSKFIINKLRNVKNHIFFEKSIDVLQEFFPITLHIQTNIEQFIKDTKKSELYKPTELDDKWRLSLQYLNSIAKIEINNYFIKNLQELEIKKNLINILTDNNILVVGNSLTVRLLDIILTDSNINFIYGNRGLSGIDGNIAIASGISSTTDLRVVLDIGDLAFLHDSNSILTARNHAKNLTILVNNNYGGQVFSLLPQAKNLENIFDEWFISEQKNISIENLAKSYGCKYYLSKNIEDFKNIFDDSKNIEGVKIIEVKYPKNQYSNLSNIYMNLVKKIEDKIYE